VKGKGNIREDRGEQTKKLARICKPAKWEKGRVVAGGGKDRPTLLKIAGTKEYFMIQTRNR